ncbi:MAG: hypothetical protein J6386_16795 [Candidatus Synoicihabitans palmerolidicus]|nr:hypothetical protein [Candidatus Synoicihabitans palmerolidicus]
MIISIATGLVGFGIFRAQRIHGALTPTGAEQWTQSQIPYLEALRYLNSQPEVTRVLLLSKWVPGVYLHKPYIKTAGHYGNRPFPSVNSPATALTQWERWQVSHVLDVEQDNWLVPQTDPRFELVHQSTQA